MAPDAASSRCRSSAPLNSRSSRATIASAEGDVSTILVVEDDDAIRSVVSEALGMAGYRVVATATSHEALREIDSDRPIDLALIDVKMPPGNPHGFALGRMAQLRRGELRLLFMSGDPTAARAEEPPGNSAVLLKPVRLEALLETVRAELAR